jgi:DNA-binding transcriptional LysR family regulator
MTMVAANLLIGIAPNRGAQTYLRQMLVVELTDVARGLTERQAIAWRRIDASGLLRMFWHGSHS